VAERLANLMSRRQQYHATVEVSGVDEFARLVLGMMLTDPDRAWPFEVLSEAFAAEPFDFEDAVKQLTKVRWIRDYWSPPYIPSNRPNRRYLELTEWGKREARSFLGPDDHRRGLLGTFLWDGSDAARIAWTSRPRHHHSRPHERDEIPAMAVDRPRGMFSAWRQEGWAAALAVRQERQRIRAEQRKNRTWSR
jgi:hypothetical protein